MNPALIYIVGKIWISVFGKFYLPEVLSNDLLDFSPASQIPPFPPASVAACAEICNGDEDM